MESQDPHALVLPSLKNFAYIFMEYILALTSHAGIINYLVLKFT